MTTSTATENIAPEYVRPKRDIIRGLDEKQKTIALREARDLLTDVLEAMDESSRICLVDLEERVEKFLGIERRPPPDLADAIRTFYARRDFTLLEDVYAMAAKKLVAPAAVDAALKALGATLKLTPLGKRVVLRME